MEPVADLDALAAALRERLLTESGSEVPGDVEGRIRALVEREAALLDAGAREALVARVAERSFGLGPLEPLLRDPAVDEVMVNGLGPVWVERGGRLERTDVGFASAADLRDAIERILAPLGRRVDEAEPLCDARLPEARAGLQHTRVPYRSGDARPSGFGFQLVVVGLQLVVVGLLVVVALQLLLQLLVVAHVVLLGHGLPFLELIVVPESRSEAAL